MPGAWGSAPAARLALPRARLRRFDRGDATSPGKRLRKGLLSPQPEERGNMARRCAWCERVFVNGRWIRGRRAEDGVVQPAATHTICEACVGDLRRKGLSV